MKYFSRFTRIVIVVAIGALTLGFFIGRYTLHSTGPIPIGKGERGTIIRLGSYSLINPLLMCDIIGVNEEVAEFEPFKKDIQNLITSEKLQGRVEDVSVYLRTLNSGRWIGVNENEKFSPASMLKVVMMMAYLKWNEADPKVLDQRITYDGSFNDNIGEQIRGSRQLEAHKSYTVGELINRMIVYSDNNARALLKQHIDPIFLNGVYDDLRLPAPPDGGGQDYMAPKEFSGVFSVLYSATYLSKSSSETALALLSKAEFHDGLVAGVPPTTIVAHKFGEREMLSSPKTILTREFHDCGIVYYPGHPYSLCVMTKGKKFSDLQVTMQNISRLVYRDIDTFFTQQENSN